MSKIRLDEIKVGQVIQIDTLTDTLTVYVEEVWEDAWYWYQVNVSGVCLERSGPFFSSLSSQKEVKVLKTSVVKVEGKRSDGFHFAVYAFGKKRRVVIGGCRRPGNVNQALKYWHDDYRVGDIIENDRLSDDEIKRDVRQRRALNKESRKLVTRLAAQVDRKLERAALKAVACKKTAKKKR